ncbi:MAG: sulfurtransferase TusA family protein [Pyrobaculum sp.]|jgi:TusA-related sulfurtransferase
MPILKRIGEKTYELDLRRYVCPYPQMHTPQALPKLPKGSVPKVLIDNQPSIENTKSAAQKEGMLSISLNSRSGVWYI